MWWEPFALLGAVFIVYFIQRLLTISACITEPQYLPAELFLVAVLAGVISVCLAGPVLLIVQVVTEFRFPQLLCAASLGWPAIIIIAARERRRLEGLPRLFPPERVQFQISELLIAVFTMGVLMFAASLLIGIQQTEMAPVFAYLICVESFAFLIAMDICRHGEHLEKKSNRTTILVGLMVVCAIPLAFVLILFSWKAWRYALWLRRTAPV